MTTQIKALAGEHVADTAARLVEAAPASCEFNGVTLTATKGTTAAEIVAYYDAETERRAKEWRESPEGRKAERRRQIEVENLQAKADRLMERLPALDFSDVRALLDWLCEAEEPRDRVGVRMSAAEITAAFRARGYESGANCGDDFNEDDRENYARWIIGQAISAPYVPMVSHFAAKWRERYPA